MKRIMGHAGYHRRVAINVGAGFVPGMNSVLMGAALAGCRLGWELVGIRDGFEGLLHPDRYPDGGLVPLSIERVENLQKAYETFPNTDFVARTPLIPGVNADEAFVRDVLAFIRPHKNVIDYELLPYHRFGTKKYEFLGKVYELADFKTPPDNLVARLNAIIDEAFGRSGQEASG